MIRHLLGASALAAALLVILPGQANAELEECAALPGEPAPNSLCLWHDQNYGGPMFALSSSADWLGGHSDEAHSLWNNSIRAWVLYDDRDFKDRRFCVRPGKRVANLGTRAIHFGDKISSIRSRPLAAASCVGYPTLL